MYQLPTAINGPNTRKQTTISPLIKYVKQILSQRNSRRIGLFLAVNLSFTFVELFYGVWANSLSLISDGFHMLLDCASLFMGLSAAVISQTLPPNRSLARVEVLSGFVNGLFLLVISSLIMAKSVGRLFNPPEINTERLLFVSVVGLLVNLVGIFAFHDHHCGGHCGHQHDQNMRGVFLHVLADALGSVGVIVSTVVTQCYGWAIADPVCSLLISLLVFASVIPLLCDTGRVLMLVNDGGTVEAVGRIGREVGGIGGVVGRPEIYVWPHLAGESCANVRVVVGEGWCEAEVAAMVRGVFAESGIGSVTVQTFRGV